MKAEGIDPRLVHCRPSKDQYQLHLGDYAGDAGNALADAPGAPQEGQKWAGPGLGHGIRFSTYDKPDEGGASCIRHSKSGWWFSRCSGSSTAWSQSEHCRSLNPDLLSCPPRCNAGNLNGHYYTGPVQAMSEDGVVWYTWHGWHYSIKSVVMMVRAADLDQPPPVLANPPKGLEA